MSDADAVDRVESDVQTELSRLGSSKSLYAATEGDLDEERVLGALAGTLSVAAFRLADWTEDDPDGPFHEPAEQVKAAHDAVAGDVDDEPADTPAGMAALPATDDRAERVGALLGWALVTDRTVTQVTGYFTGQADPQTASTVRELGDDVEAIRDAAVTAIEDRDAAVAAATNVVKAAYDRYFETLEGLGVNPKPVC